MFKWWQISMLLCCYGFFREYRPSEPFISPFLTGEWKNFTDQQVTEEIYPVGIYFNLALLVAVFLLTDYLRYKPVLIIGGLAGITTWTLLAVGKTILVMQIVEFFYGIFMASEVAYYTYIYAKVEKKEHYQKVTSHTRTAYLLGKASAGLSSQLFVEFKIFDYLELNYVTISALVVTTIVSIVLPSVPESVYFHRSVRPTNANEDGSGDRSVEIDGVSYPIGEISGSKPGKLKTAFYYLYEDLKEAYTNAYVLKWSIWWALATCGYLQIVTYSQFLWQEINRNVSAELYNGVVEFLYSIVGAAAAFGIGYLKLQWRRWGELALGILSLVQGACIFSAASMTSLYLAYAVHIGYGVLYQSAITIASSEVAKEIREDSYALIFGINTFAALVLQTILTAIVINSLGCPIRTQIYGCYLFVTGCVFMIIAMFILCRGRRSYRNS